MYHLLQEIESKMEKAISKLAEPKIADILRVQQAIVRAVHQFMFEEGVIEIRPIMISPISDCLNHSVIDATIDYADQKWTLTKSMIFHKQLAISKGSPLKAVYIVSPNVRLELSDRKDTGRHLFEFTQIDFELRDATQIMVILFTERLIRYIFASLEKEIPDVLRRLRGDDAPSLLAAVEDPLEVHRTENVPDDMAKSCESSAPFWLLNHKREFYDKESPTDPGTYLNYDLVWPEGYGEALSGGEREYEYEQLLRRMEPNGTDKKMFADYLRFAKEGRLVPSAGAGFGLERMTRYICGLRDIDEVTVFSRKPFGMPIHF